jgi:phage tail sheath gpL-like
MTTAVPDSAVSRVVGIKTNFVNLRGAVKFLPQRIAVFGQGSTASQASYATTKKIVTSAKEVGDTYGYGSPLHLAVKELLPPQGGGVGIIPVTIFPLKDEAGAVATTGSITPVGTQTAQKTYYILVNNIKSKEFTLAVNATVADAVGAIVTAINSVINMPVVASNVGPDTSVGLEAKWKGASGNDIQVEVVGTEAGIVFTTLVNSDGATNPVITSALAQVANVWETLILNCMNKSDTTTLDLFRDFFEPRWGPTVKKPAMVFTGETEADQATAITIPEARKAERINGQLVAPGSKNLPFVVAAAQLAKIAVVANGNPPVDYAGQQCFSITPGTDAEQWDYIKREAAVVGGSSAIEVVDNVIEMSDTTTFYHPTGEKPPAYRFANDIQKVWQVLFNLALIFEADEWKGAPLIPDDQPTVNPLAKKPKSAVTAIGAMLDSLGLEAIVSDPAAAKKTIVAAIDDGNPRRLNVSFTYQISGNTGIISIDANWGFFFGTAQVVEV